MCIYSDSWKFVGRKAEKSDRFIIITLDSRKVKKRINEERKKQGTGESTLG